MKSLALLVATLAACTEPLPREERQLADISELTAVVDTDVGVPQDPFGTPNIATGLSVLIDYANTDTCYSLHASATARVDGLEPDVFFTGGLESSSEDADSYCTKPAIFVDEK